MSLFYIIVQIPIGIRLKYTFTLKLHLKTSCHYLITFGSFVCFISFECKTVCFISSES